MILQIYLTSKCHENCFKSHNFQGKTQKKKILIFEKTDFWIIAQLKQKNHDIS